MTQLDAAELGAWLTRVTQAIDRALLDAARSEAITALKVELADARVGLSVLTQLALLDDCLRIAQNTIELAARGEPPGYLVRIAAPKYFQVLPRYESFDDGATTPEEVGRFFATYRDDAGAFGYANATPWRGVALTKHVERVTHNTAPMRDLERMLVRIVDTVLAAGDGKRTTQVEQIARRRLRDLFQPTTPAGQDPRAVAFCRADGPEVFSSVAHGSQIHERDPFDVESIHAEAREAFHRLLVRATTPEQHQHGHGRTLLVLGDSGSGKTHLLRALRYQVCSQRLGYVGYMQMTSEVGEYARYVLRNFIDSLERPYDAPAFTESGLLYLADGLAEGHTDIPRADLERLRGDVLTPDELATLIGGMVDRVLRTDGLGGLESDLIHALLLLQRRDPALQRRVIRFLRCESLNAYEQQLLGGLAPRDRPEDPMRTLQQLGRIAYELQLAALVLLVDQVEDTVPDGKTVLRLQQAVDVLRGIADSVPSAIIVISCLDDVYTVLRPMLSRSLLDRLERDPPPARLASQRQRDEIEAMLLRRLDHLYSTFDVATQDDDPLYPFTRERVDAVNLFRARDAIAKFREFHEACIATGVVDTGTAIVHDTAPPPDAPAPPKVTDLDRIWNDALASATGMPDDDQGVLALVADAMLGAAGELGFTLDVRLDGQRLVVEGQSIARRVIELCNGGAQGGHLGNQLDALRGLVSTGAVPVALRNSDWQFKQKSKINKQVGELIAAGGLAVVLEERQLRAVVAAGELARHPGFASWRNAHRPISHLAFVREILDLDNAPRFVPRRITAPIPEPRRPAKPAARLASVTGPIAAPDPGSIRIGETDTARKESVLVSVDSLKRHAAFLGSPGSGKTTAALLAIEQLLERGISVLLVDRKGDLARYASDDWWRADGDDRDRRMALREAIDVALYTPGNAQGRPLRIPVIPTLDGAGDAASTQDRDQIARFAASGLAGMMGYGSGSSFQKKQAILQCAIQLHAGEREVTLDVLRETINRPDPELLAAVGPLQRYFAPLAEDLQSLGIQRAALLAGEGEPLDIEQLLPPLGGRPRLSIIHTAAFAEVPVLQFWVSRLLVELGRLARTRPSPTLQAVAFLDEADSYVPASATPPTKEPMFDLLKRARAAGIGIMLATQNPGDFDYKARDLIETWLLGKITQDRAIDKMRNLIGPYPNANQRIATQPSGHFAVIAGGAMREIKGDRSMMITEQLAEHEVVALAKSSRPRS